jgi:DNA-binding transcriptional LysR family regulator
MMDVDAIRTFVTIARLGGFGRAAQVLHRSQPAISRRIELLEGELGLALFERLRRGVLLTDAGRALLPHAEAALAALRDGGEAVRAVATGDRGTISLALVGTLASTRVTELLRVLRDRHPQIRLELRTARSEEVSELVAGGEATLGLRYFPDSSPFLVSRPVGEEALVVACAADHKLARRRRARLRPSDLAGERWLAFPPRRGRQEHSARTVERQLDAAGLGAAEIVPIDSLTAQKRMVEAGFGIALLGESAIEEERRLGTLAVLDVAALRTTIPICLIHRRNGYLGAPARALLAALSAGSAPYRVKETPRRGRQP